MESMTAQRHCANSNFLLNLVIGHIIESSNLLSKITSLRYLHVQRVILFHFILAHLQLSTSTTHMVKMHRATQPFRTQYSPHLCIYILLNFHNVVYIFCKYCHHYYLLHHVKLDLVAHL